jgi:NTP pyrophosphatase (non-canonical NTP hydrolase)
MKKKKVKLNKLASAIYQANAEKGFWDRSRNNGEMLMLIVSELGEAMEALRKGRIADWTTHDDNIGNGGCPKANFESCIKDTFEDEIADSLIRILDMCGGLGIDIERHVREKLAFNTTRERLHGKNF